MTSWEFPGSEPIDIVIKLGSGSIALAGEATDVTTVQLEPASHLRHSEDLLADVRVSFNDGVLEIIQQRGFSFQRAKGGLTLTVRAPAGSRVKVEAGSADLACVGEFADLASKTGSGDVTVASVSGELDVETGSGDVLVESTGAAATTRTASGDILVRQAGGDLAAYTASGDVSIGSAAASVQVQTAAGDVQIKSVAAGATEVKTVSGDISVGVAVGTDVYLDLSSLTGRVKNQLEETGHSDGVSLRLTCRCVNGDIKVSRADAVAAR